MIDDDFNFDLSFDGEQEGGQDDLPELSEKLSSRNEGSSYASKLAGLPKAAGSHRFGRKIKPRG